MKKWRFDNLPQTLYLVGVRAGTHSRVSWPMRGCLLMKLDSKAGRGEMSTSDCITTPERPPLCPLVSARALPESCRLRLCSDFRGTLKTTSHLPGKEGNTVCLVPWASRSKHWDLNLAGSSLSCASVDLEDFLQIRNLLWKIKLCILNVMRSIG